MSRLLVLCSLLAALAPSCSADGANTQVMVTVDAEPGIRSMARTLIVRVYGGPRGGDPSTFPMLQGIPQPVSVSGGWPNLVALAPLDRDASRIYRVEAAAYDVISPSETTVPIAIVRAVSGYVPNQTVWLRLLLQDECLGIACVGPVVCPTQFCTCENGLCIDATRRADTLPPYDPDGSVPTMDAGTDAGGDVGLDAAPIDGGALCTPASCDDHLSCTDDSCGASGCVHVARDAMCSDGNLCTDDHCNGTADDGCTHVANAAACDDGNFCNGMDHCMATTCASHDGNPCGVLGCDPIARACTGCTTTAECPGPTMGSWSACAYGSLCAEAGTQSRNLRSYTCNASHLCTYVDTSESQACGTRSTGGIACGGSSCDPAGTCVYGSTCDESGLSPRTCHDFACAGGSCNDFPFSSPLPCSRNTDTMSCDDGNACTTPDRCTGGACSGPVTCDSSLPDAGRPMDAGSCDDGYDCTFDPGDGGMCAHIPNHGYCNYGGACSTGMCMPGAGSDLNGCVFVYACPDAGMMRDGGSSASCLGNPSICSDGDSCTDDSCSPGAPFADPLTGCVHLPGFCLPDGGTD